MTADPETVAGLVDRLNARRSDALTTLELLNAYRQQVSTDAADLENPHAVLAYIDFFTTFVGRAVEECERAASELPHRATQGIVDTLRQIASNSAAEQRRCLLFRDRWINKPLSHERLRPLLNEISVTTRDQLTAFRDLNDIAAQAAALLSPGDDRRDDKKGFDRRALFTRLFKPE